MWERAKGRIYQGEWPIGVGLIIASLATVSALRAHGEAAISQAPTITESRGAKSSSDPSWEKRSILNDAFAASKTPAGNSGSPPAISPQLASLIPQVQSAALRKVMGLEGSGTYHERSENLNQLNRPLSLSDQQWLYGFLATSVSIPGMSDATAHGLKDGIMVFLTEDLQTDPQTVEILRQMYLDTSQDATIRTYVVQYMAYILPQLKDETQRSSIQKFLETISQDPTQVGSSAALLGLERASDWESSTVKSADVGQLALKTALDVNVPQLKRMQPLQLCGQMGIEQAAPVARDLAINGTHAMVRMAALATLGELGQETDISLLTKAASDPDDRIRSAAASALIVLKSRLKQ
jgi:hypothetical protein